MMSGSSSTISRLGLSAMGIAFDAFEEGLLHRVAGVPQGGKPKVGTTRRGGYFPVSRRAGPRKRDRDLRGVALHQGARAAGKAQPALVQHHHMLANFLDVG